MFKVNKSMFKPKGGSPMAGKPEMGEEHSLAKGHGDGVGPDHPHHEGGQNYQKLVHQPTGHIHEISHHDDNAIHHTVSHPEHASSHLVHTHGQPSQIVNPGQEDGSHDTTDSLAAPMPAIP